MKWGGKWGWLQNEVSRQQTLETCFWSFYKLKTYFPWSNLQNYNLQNSSSGLFLGF